MDYLNEKQKASFAAINALFGLGPDELTAQPVDKLVDSDSNVSVMSSDPNESHFTPHIVPVGSIAELRKLAGFPEKATDSLTDEIDYPPPPSAEEMNLASGLTAGKINPDDDLKARIDKAAQCFVLGNPENVKDYEPLINATMFPGQVALFTGDTLDVPANTTHVISGNDPVVLNYAKIVVGENATISVQTGVTINSQIFIQQ